MRQNLAGALRRPCEGRGKRGAFGQGRQTAVQHELYPQGPRFFHYMVRLWLDICAHVPAI